MNTHDTLLRALAKGDASSPEGVPAGVRRGTGGEERRDAHYSIPNALFEGFASDEEIVAAFLDGQLTAAQSEAVKAMLVASSSLRQTWQASAAALSASEQQSAQASSRSVKTGVWLSLAASVAMLAVFAVRQPDLWQPAPLASTEQVESLIVEQISAPTLASQAVPLMAWQAYLLAYQLPDGAAEMERPGPQDDSSADAPDKDNAISNAISNATGNVTSNGDYASFSDLAEALLALQAKCSDAAALAFAQQRFAVVREQYPAALVPLAPKNPQQWCDLGRTLQQYADMAVSASNIEQR